VLAGVKFDHQLESPTTFKHIATDNLPMNEVAHFSVSGFTQGVGGPSHLEVDMPHHLVEVAEVWRIPTVALATQKGLS
jgi:hypothetical protein